MCPLVETQNGVILTRASFSQLIHPTIRGCIIYCPLRDCRGNPPELWVKDIMINHPITYTDRFNALSDPLMAVPYINPSFYDAYFRLTHIR